MGKKGAEKWTAKDVRGSPRKNYDIDNDDSIFDLDRVEYEEKSEDRKGTTKTIDYFKVCFGLANSIMKSSDEISHPAKFLLLSSGTEEPSLIEHKEVKSYVNKLFPHFQGKLRPKQKEAIQTFIEKDKDIVLAVPTAYEKL